MNLPHSDDAAIMDSNGELHITDVLADDLGIVTDAIRNIEAGISSDAFPTLTPHKAVQ